MKVQELMDDTNIISSIAQYIITGNHSKLDRVIPVLLQDTSLVYKGHMYRFLASEIIKPTPRPVSWSMSIRGVTEVVNNFTASGENENGIIIKQIGKGLNIPAVISKYGQQLTKFIDSDDAYQVNNYLDEEEVISPTNHPVVVATVREGRISFEGDTK